MRKLITITFLSAIATFACAQDATNQLTVKTGRVELVVPNMPAQDSAPLVRNGLSSFAVTAHANFRSLPAVIPARPGVPETVQKYVMGAPVIEYQCKDAYAEISKRPAPIRNALILDAEVIQACVYPFEKGSKIYLIYTSVRKTESLTSGLFNGIVRAVRGGDEDWMLKKVNENVTLIKNAIPSTLIERIEIPGKAISEPDKEAITALIPPLAPVVSQPAQVIPAPATLATPQPSEIQGSAVASPAMMMAPPSLLAPTQPVSAGRAPSSIERKIEARKSLTAMGLTYHDPQQFIAAIKRKDEIATQLFVDAGGVDLAAKDAAGKTPMDIARDTGSESVIRILAGETTTSTQMLVTSAPISAPTPVTATNPGSVPPDMLAKIDAQLDGMNLTSEQRQKMRERVIANIEQITRQINQNQAR